MLASTLLKCCCARFIWANHSWHFIDINMKSAANGIVQRFHANRMWTNKTLTKKCWKKNWIKKLVIGKVWRDATDLMWKRINNNIKTCNNFDKLEFDIWWKLKRKVAKNCKMANTSDRRSFWMNTKDALQLPCLRMEEKNIRIRKSLFAFNFMYTFFPE